MKFIFTESFSLKWNGYIARNEKGISGTHNASMYLAEALANLGHDVTMLNTSCYLKNIIHRDRYSKRISIKGTEIIYNNNIIIGEHLGVKYINISDIEDSIDCDYIITTYNVDDLDILKKVNNYKKVIMIINNPFTGANNIELLKNFDKNKIIIAYISNYSKDNILLLKEFLPISDYGFLNNYNSILLYNSIDINDIKPIVEKENSFIFFACLERGYKVALEVRNRFNPEFKMYTNTYDDKNRKKIEVNNNIIMTENTSKNNIFEYCAKGKYFVYSLVDLDTGYVHNDTFAYVVLEALLHGVVVITPRLLLFEELYGDAICYIETDDIIPRVELTHTKWNNKNSNFGLPLVDRYVEKLRLLESNKELYNSYVQKGLLLKDKFDNKKVVNVLLNAINA
jgi:hypothetical protein